MRTMGVTMRAIVERLACEGVTGRTGHPLQLSQVAKICEKGMFADGSR